MKTCINCGNPMLDEMKFCAKCGTNNEVKKQIITVSVTAKGNGIPKDSTPEYVENNVLIENKAGRKEVNVLKIIKIVYLVIASVAGIGILFSKPEFAASSKDILVYRASNFLPFFFIFILPGIFILSKSIRKRIPLFKKEKLIATMAGWVLLFFIAMIVSSSIDSLHSAQFKLANANYNTQQLQKEKEREADKATAEATANAKAEAKAKAKTKAKTEVKAKADRQTAGKTTGKSTANLSEADYKALCIDLPWAEVVKDRKTYVGTYLKKDLMVRQISTDSITGETVYICGEKKAESNYMGGTFTVFDRRSNKTRPIELYDKIYAYGQITGIFMTYGSYDPEFKVKYVQFNGKFGQ